MSFKVQVKRLRLERGLSKVEFAKRLGVSEGTVRQWESGKNEPRMGAVEKIAEKFNVSKSYLLGLDAPESVRQESDEIAIAFLGKVSAGAFESDAAFTSTVTIPRSVLKGRNPDDCIALQVNGDSMNKVLPNESYIIVHKTDTVTTGDILVLRLGNEYTVKQVRLTETMVHLEPISYSEEFKTNSYPIDELNEIHSVGKVIYNFRAFI